MFLSDGFHIETVNAGREPLPSSLKQYVGIVILGGPMSVYDNMPHLMAEQNLIRVAIASDVPVLGICLGSQLIAQATGGQVHRGTKKEIGWHDVWVTPAGGTDVLKGMASDKPFRVFQWHGDTYDLPPSALVLARSELYPQAFRIRSAIGIQFHLEVDTALIRLWIQEYEGEMRAEKILPENVLPKEGDIESLSAKCKVLYSNFARMLRAKDAAMA